MKKFLVPINVTRVTGLVDPIDASDAITRDYFERIIGDQITSGTITRTNGRVTSVAVVGGDNITIGRDASGYIQTVTKSGKTITFTRNPTKQITSWNVT